MRLLYVVVLIFGAHITDSRPHNVNNDFDFLSLFNTHEKSKSSPLEGSWSDTNEELVDGLINVLMDDDKLDETKSTSSERSADAYPVDPYHEVPDPSGWHKDTTKDKALPDATETRPLQHALAKRSSTKQVEGCYTSNTSPWMWGQTGERFNFGNQNSNHKCQKKCRNEGKILSATQSTWCYCGNIFPKGRKVADSLCNTRCVFYTGCYGPQECCGGSSYYSLSVVGDIDVAREILERLRSKWSSVSAYRSSILSSVGVRYPNSFTTANWVGSFDKQGWSECPKTHNNFLYMHGLWRSSKQGNKGIYLLEQADCRENAVADTNPQECYKADWWKSFDAKGWSTCKSGYYMTGLYRNKGKGDQLYLIEEAMCCKPKTVKWGQCIDHNVWSSFDNEGWSNCPAEYYMTGLWRNDCDQLHCIEWFKCCKMATDPVFSVVVKDMKKNYNKECTMKVNGDYTCKQVNTSPRMSLVTKSFDVEDQSPLNVAQPRVIPGLKPKICSSSSVAYSCKLSRSVATTKGSQLSIGTGFSMGYSQTVGAEVGYEGFGASAKASFSSTLSVTASFNAGYTTSKSKTITDTIEVSVNVPKNTQVTIDVKRVKQDLVYFWKGNFELMGSYTVQYGGRKINEDVTRILAGNDRLFYSFGKWEYPGTDFHKVIITDKYGTKEKNCGQLEDKDKTCNANL